MCESEASSKELQEQLQRCKMEVEEQKRRVIETRKILATRHSHELDGRIGQMAEALMLEIEEAQICLDREEPNVGMALNRIRDMRTIIETANR